MKEILPIWCSVLVVALTCFSTYLCYWKPKSCGEKLRKQGIEGPSPSLFLGNTPQMNLMIAQISETPKIDGPFTIFPYFKHWTSHYGKLFNFALGRIQILYVSDLNIVREINCLRSMEVGKPDYLQNERGALLGKGLITTNGTIWLHQRKTIAPHLCMDNVKDMLNLIVESGNILIKSWEKKIEREGGKAEILVDDDVRNFTTFITSKMIFGDDHQKAIKIFQKCQALIKVTGSATTLGIPLSRFLPIKTNREAWRLSKEIHKMIMEIAKDRLESSSSSKEDILQVIIDGSKQCEIGTLKKEEFIVDNCKNMMLAASEVNALTAIWGLMLLASHPEWQERARSQVFEISAGNFPDFHMLGKMKLLDMIVHEILRLYPAAAASVSRKTLKDIKLGNILAPKGVNIWIWTLALHRDPGIWGLDSNLFNPERFVNGISGACKSSQAYIPFGVGARVCPGKKLAIIQLKLFLALILPNFKLKISPNYHHSPRFMLLLEPEYGVKLLIEKI